jgi:hypothetical protein
MTCLQRLPIILEWAVCHKVFISAATLHVGQIMRQSIIIFAKSATCYHVIG